MGTLMAKERKKARNTQIWKVSEYWPPISAGMLNVPACRPRARMATSSRTEPAMV